MKFNPVATLMVGFVWWINTICFSLCYPVLGSVNFVQCPDYNWEVVEINEFWDVSACQG